MKLIIAVAALILLAACQAQGAKQPSQNDPCGASGWQYLAGMPASALDKSALPKGARVLHPTTPMTRDYRLDRLNIHVSENGLISRITCG